MSAGQARQLAWLTSHERDTTAAAPTAVGQTMKPSPGETSRKRPAADGLARVACLGCRKVKVRCQAVGETDACDRCLKLRVQCERPESLRGKWDRKRHPDKRTVSGSPKPSQPPMIDSHSEAPPLPSRSPHVAQPQLDPLAGFSFETEDPLAALTSLATSSRQTLLPDVTIRSSKDSDWSSDVPPTEQNPHIQSGAEEVRDFNGRLHFKIAHQVPPYGILAETSMELSDSLVPGHGRPGRHPPPDPGRLGQHTLLGMANNGYFAQSLQKHLRPSRSGQTRTPAILAQNIITVEQSRNLFEVFFKHCQPLVALLDDRIVTPSVCSSKSPFLFTVVCAVASRYRQSDLLFKRLLKEAHREGMEAMFSAKSVCTVQGFLLMSWWNQPTASFEDDNTYLYAGIAFRIAQEIGLHHTVRINFPLGFNPDVQKQYELELLDRQRTYRCCYVHDRNIMSQGGKPDSMLETYTIRAARTDYDHPLRTLYDVRVAANVERMQVITRLFYLIYINVDSLSGISSSIDFGRLVVRDMHFRIDNWYNTWSGVIRNDYASHPSHDLYQALLGIEKSVTKLNLFYICLARLLQSDPASLETISFTVACYSSAQDVLQMTRDRLGNLGVLRYAPDHMLIDIVYCATILLKLVRSDVSHVLERNTAMELVHDVILVLENAAEDETHPPMLYAIFLRKQIAHIRDQSEPTNRPDDLSSLLLSDILAPESVGQQPSGENPGPALPQQTIDYVSGSTTDPFRPESLFDSIWLDTLLSTQFNSIRPYVGDTESGFWELFGREDKEG